MDNKATKWTMEEIIDWCKANNQVAWLKEEASKQVERKVYPKIASTSKSGKKTWKQDKSQEPKIELSRPSFMEIRSAFINKFISPSASKKPSIYELIDSL